VKGFYSVRPKIWPGSRPTPLTSASDPYDQAGAGFAERNRKHTVALPNGLVREDIGEPLSRLPSETQPRPKGNPKAAQVEAPKAPAEAPAAILAMAPAKPRKPHRAITREP
jgi:hypothetical protein